MSERLDHGIRRIVTFTPWCNRCGWEGEPLQFKGDGAYVLARHMVDRHGGTPRLGGESPTCAVVQNPVK